MGEMKLITHNAFIWSLAGKSVEVSHEGLVYAILVYKKEFSDSQLHRVKAAIDRETLHRSKLIQSQTKVTHDFLTNPLGGDCR